MRRFILWIAAILITFAIGVGAERLWSHFFSAPPAPTTIEPTAVNVALPQRVYLPGPAPLPAATPSPPNLILDYDSEKLSVWAVFYIMGPQSKEFADIDSIQAMLNPEVKDYPGEISLYTHSGTDYDNVNANFALVTTQRMFFATEKSNKGDFTYVFDGKFVRTDFDVVAQKDKAVLRGTLTKMKDGRTIAQQEFTFRMEYMGC